MKAKNVLKKLRNVFEMFIICCVLGWFYESFWWMAVDLNYKFVNRGYLLGPWLPIYGFGMIFISFIFKKLKIKNSWLVFLLGALIATAAELAASYVIEAAIGSSLWSYEELAFNFEGRIALKSSVYFGLLILFGIKGLEPAVAKFQNKFDKSIIRNVAVALTALVFFADVALTVSGVWATLGLK